MNGLSQNKEIKPNPNEEMILDIGPRTINKIKNIIDNSKTILWNGPAGIF